MNMHNFTRGAAANPGVTARLSNGLDLDALRVRVPSAFAVEPHHSRSARYAYIPTVEVITAMMEEGFKPFEAKQSKTRLADKQDFTKHMIRFRHPDAAREIKVGDSIPEIVLINSHDGSSAYKLMAGLFRLVCSNGLIVADGTINEINVQHKGNIAHNVIEGSFKIVEEAPKALEQVNRWSGLQLTDGKRQAFGEAARVIRFGDSEGNVKTTITAQQLLAPRRYEDKEPTLWKTTNVLQENIMKGGITGRRQWQTNEKTGRRELSRASGMKAVNGIDADAKLNKALWALAERMAELKAA
jgi:hypothetical protein